LAVAAFDKIRPGGGWLFMPLLCGAAEFDIENLRSAVAV
jgi:hypothetical protein